MANNETLQSNEEQSISKKSKATGLLEIIKALNNGQSFSHTLKMTDQQLKEVKDLETLYPYLKTGSTLLTMPPDETPNLWHPFLNRQSLTALTGGSDLGKSTFLHQLASSIVLKKKEFLGHPLNVRYGRVIYFMTEDNEQAVSTLLQKQQPMLSPGLLSGLCYIFETANPLKVIEEQLKQAKTDAVIIDCFSDIFNGNSNDIVSVRNWLESYKRLSHKYDTQIIFLHHVGKRTENGLPSKNNVIGSQGFEGKMRLVMEMRKEKEHTRNLWFTKGNYLSEEIKKHALQLEFDDRQTFKYIGKAILSNQSNNKFESSKGSMLKTIKDFQSKKLTRDKMVIELKKLFGEDAPSKGTLHKWIKELDAGQSTKE